MRSRSHYGSPGMASAPNRVVAGNIRKCFLICPVVITDAR